MSGAIALNGLNGDINGIDCMIAHVRKYTLAYLLN